MNNSVDYHDYLGLENILDIQQVEKMQILYIMIFLSQMRLAMGPVWFLGLQIKPNHLYIIKNWAKLLKTFQAI